MDNYAELLQDQVDKYQGQLASIKSYIQELKDMTERHGTDSAHYEVDLLEAENNAKYYEDELARIKKELGRTSKAMPARGGTGSGLPQALKPGVNTLIFTSISFVAGILIGSMLLSRRDSASRDERSRADSSAM